MVKRTDTPQEKVVEKGRHITHGLQVNKLTLEEHQRRIVALRTTPLNYEEACKIHGKRAADKYFNSVEP